MAMTTRCVGCGGATFEPVCEVSRTRAEPVEGGVATRVFTLPLGRCRTCGHVMVTAPPDDAALRELYLHYLGTPPSTAPLDVGGLEPRHLRNDRALETLDFLGPELSTLDGEGPLVDVGCGLGELLRVLHTRAQVPTQRLLGLDFTRALPDVYETAFELVDLSHLDETSTTPVAPSSAAAMFCTHVLEHLRDPQRLLRWLRVTVAPTGFVYLEVPDHHTVLDRNLPSAPHFISVVTPEHLHAFSLDSFTRLVSASGFSVVRAERAVVATGRLAALRVVARPAPHLETARGVRAEHEGLTRWLDAAVADILAALAGGGPVAFWGGGYGLRLLVAHAAGLREQLATGAVRLFDGTLAGQRVDGAVVEPEAALRDFAGTLFITVTQSDARAAMLGRSATACPEAKVVDVLDWRRRGAGR
jgi:SAM-dependent methyltransferase